LASLTHFGDYYTTTPTYCTRAPRGIYTGRPNDANIYFQRPL